MSGVVLCVIFIQGCTKDALEDSPVLRAELRSRLHAQMAGNTLVSNRDSWDIIAAASRLPGNTVRLFYRRDAIDETHRASGKNQNQADYWNREHVWPQSYGLRSTAAARDLHNIVPSDRTVNTSRGNKYFGSAATPHKECKQCTSSRSTWEPPVDARGDVARILFYMDVRYEGDDDVPDLSLSDSPDKDNAEFGQLGILFQWHCSDQVSAEEKQKNETVAKAQGNRNVFIDTPTLAQRVYGFECAHTRW